MSTAAFDSCRCTPKLVRSVISLLVASVVLTSSAGAARAATPTASNSPGPLLWTAPGGADTRPIDGISCPSTALCVAVDRGGYVLWSTDPAGGPLTWAAADVDGSTEITSVSCPSTALCVAVDAAGNVITSQSPTGGGSAWAVAHVDRSTTQNNTDNAGAVLVRGLSCPSTMLCVAVDAAGNALVSTDPVGGSSAWTTTHIDTNPSYGCTGTGLTCQPPLVGISCPSVALCVAVDFSGNLLTTTAPASALPWTSTPTDAGALSSLYGVSCPVIGFCATVDGDAGRAITLDPATPASQSSRLLPDSLYGIWCQSQSLCLASVETQDGISGLLGSFDPAAPASSWTLSSLGGVNAVACPSVSLCLAADDEGNIAAGVTTTAITAALRSELLATRHVPTIAALLRTRSETLTFTSPITAQLNLSWTIAGARAGSAPVTVAAVGHSFKAPGTATLTLRLNAAGQRLFKSARSRVRLTAKATFGASTGSVSAVTQLTFLHPRARK